MIDRENFYKYLKIRRQNRVIVPMENPLEFSKKMKSSEWHKNLMRQFPNEGQRQTGRTTHALYNALIDASNGDSVMFAVRNHSAKMWCRSQILFWLETLPFAVEKINGDEIKIKTIDGEGCINFVVTHNPKHETFKYRFVYIDNSIYDVMGWS